MSRPAAPGMQPGAYARVSMNDQIRAVKGLPKTIRVACGYCHRGLGNYALDDGHADEDGVRWWLDLPHDETTGGWDDDGVWVVEGDRDDVGRVVEVEGERVEGSKRRAALMYRCDGQTTEVEHHVLIWSCEGEQCRRVRSVRAGVLSSLIERAIERNAPLMLR